MLTAGPARPCVPALEQTQDGNTLLLSPVTPACVVIVCTLASQCVGVDWLSRARAVMCRCVQMHCYCPVSQSVSIVSIWDSSKPPEVRESVSVVVVRVL